MAQCEKILENGERCSNRAAPGRRFCETHGRITFRKLRAEQAADTAPPPVKSTPDAVTSEWEAAPSPAGRSPHFPGLRPDQRNILVAPEGLIWLADDVKNDKAPSLFDRLVTMLGFFSQTTPLHADGAAPQVRIVHDAAKAHFLVGLHPNNPDAADLSTFYDAASTAARLVQARLYVGQKRAFVQYRDDSAPRGYDVPDYKSARGSQDLLLIAHWGSQRFDLSRFLQISLAELALAIQPVPDVAGALPSQIYALAARPLYGVLARYCRAHALRYQLAQLHNDGESWMLFDIRPNPEMIGDAVVPAFVLAYLSRLPQVILLRRVVDAPPILLQWRRRFPLHIPHVSGAFDAEEMVLLSYAPHASRRVQPIPQFLDGDRLTDVYIERPPAQPLTVTDTGAALQVPVLLRPDDGPTPAPAALLLTPRETSWLRPLLYRLPSDRFDQYLLCQGQELSVLISQNGPVEGIPFGLPMRRLEDTELFLPLRSRLKPALPWPLLRQALDVQQGVFTFLTESFRLDIKAAEFRPLSRALLAQTRNAPFKLSPPISPPALKWQPRPKPQPVEKDVDIDEDPDLAPEEVVEDLSLLERMMGGRRPQPTRAGQDESPPLPETDAAQQSGPPAETEPSETLDMTAFLQEQAQRHEAAGELMMAAICYDLAGDTANGGRCYRQMASADFLVETDT